MFIKKAAYQPCIEVLLYQRLLLMLFMFNYCSHFLMSGHSLPLARNVWNC